jgi:hypothetical protein
MLWLLFCAGSISAQSNPHKDIELQLLDAFSTLDMSEVNTGILYNRVPEYVLLNKYDGTSQADSIAMDYKTFSLTYGMINMAHIDKSAILPTDLFLHKVNEWKKEEKVILGAMYYKYDKFRDDIIENNLIVADTVKKQMTRGSNRWGSPYIEDTLFTFSCMKNRSNSLQQRFSISPEAFFTNISSGFTNIEIDFDDGRDYIRVNVGDEIKIDYRNYGKYLIKIRVRDENGKHLFSRSLIEIVQDETEVIPRSYGSARLVHTNQNIEVWWYSNDNCEIDDISKPLILIDGFDLNNVYDAEIIFGILTKKSPNSLSDILFPEDYDLFFLNYIDSKIDIFENGSYVREAIEWINGQKAIVGSNEKNVVIGFCMGSLVGKVALRSMELDGIDHETEMFFSYDSPLKGANIPMGMQCMIKHLAEYRVAGIQLQTWAETFGIESFGNVINGLNSPAARQMLYYHESNADWITDNWILDRKHTEAEALKSGHDEFYAEFEGMGNLEIPHIAISNGAIIPGDKSTVGQGYLPEQVILSEHLDLYDLMEHVDITDPSPYDILGVIGIVVAGNAGIGFNFDVLVASLPEGTGVIYNGYFRIQFLYLGWLGNLDIREVRGAKPYDSCPGGSRSLNLEGVPLEWNAVAHCFIPTISSLGLDDISNNIDPYYVSDLTNPSNVLQNTYCAAYIGSTSEKSPYQEFFPNFLNYNEEHIFISEDIKNFLSGYLVASDYLSDEVSSLGNVIENRNYNFGRPEVNGYQEPFRMSNIIDFDLNINTYGKLWINRAGKLAFSDLPPNRINSYPQEYCTIIKGAECESVPVTVNVNTSGEINISDQSISNKGILEIWHKAILNINQGGLLKLENKSEILVKSGGKLRLNDQATLQMYGDSKIVVERGAELIINRGAKMMLEKAMTSDELGSKIVVYGKLTVDGGLLDLSSGLGYIVFEEGSKLYNINTEQVQWVGHGKDDPAFVVRNELKLGLNTIFENANVQMERNILVHLPFNPFIAQELVLNNSYLHTASHSNNGPITLECRNGRNVKIKSSEFFDVMFVSDNFNSISCEYLKATSKSILVNMKISNAMFLSLKNTEIYCRFFGNNTLPDGLVFERIGLDVDHVAYTILESSKIENKLYVFGPTDGITLRGENDPSSEIKSKAIKIENSSLLKMTNSMLKEANFGIYSSGAINIVMDNSTIRDCFSAGIEMTGTVDAGLVRMTCSNLINNGVGINGTDILLDIDAHIISQTMDGNVRTNTFISGPYNHFFNICYMKKHPDNPVFARGNIWNHPESGYIHLYQSDNENNCSSWSNITVVREPSFGSTIHVPPCLIYEKEDCFEPHLPGFPLVSNVWIDPVEYTHFCFDANTCTGVNIHSTFWKAMNCLYNDQPDTLTLNHVFTTLSPLSIEFQTYNSQFYEAYCRHILAVSNAFAGGQADFEQQSITIDIEQICDNGYQGTTDIVFLLDASGSISTSEFADMKNSVISTLNELSSSVPIRYAITQFSGTNQFEVSIPFTTDISLASGFERSFMGLTDVKSAFINLKNMLTPEIGNLGVIDKIHDENREKALV